MFTKPANIAKSADVPPPPKGGFGFIWRCGLGWGVVGVVLFLMPISWLSGAALPLAVGMAGLTAGYISFRRQEDPYFMPSLRHGAWAGALALLPTIIFLGLAVSPDILTQGGVDPDDAVYGRTMIALGLCCVGVPFALILGALGGVGGALLAHMRAHPLEI